MRIALLFLAYCVIGFGHFAFSQQKRVSGFIRDRSSGEKLVHANVLTPDYQQGTFCNNEGYFSIVLKANQDRLMFSYIGYKTRTLEIESSKDTMIYIDLESNTLLNEIEVSAKKNFNDQPGTEIPVVQIKMAPAMLGEVDVFKSLQMLPGVKNTREGFSGFVVRGGSPDQNLILIDDIPIYSSSHFYGLFSVINENTLQSVNFIKGAIPVKFGGRLSSVVSIITKEGNRKKQEKEFSVGLMSGSFMINGPLKNGKTTYCISARRSMVDLIMLPYSLVFNKPREAYYFGDLSAKLVHNISYKDKLSISLFASKDKRFDNSNKREYEYQGEKVEMQRDQGYMWGNYVLSVKWNRIESSRLTFNNSIYTSNFFLERHIKDKVKNQNHEYRNESSFKSNILDIGFRSDWQYHPFDFHRINWGITITNHHFKPGISTFHDNNAESGETVNNSYGDLPVDLMESVGYVDYNLKLAGILSLNAGFRLTAITTSASKFIIPEPRVSSTLHLANNSRLTIYYERTSQFFHLLRSSILELPTDLWLPSSSDFPPEKAKQYGIESSYITRNGLEFTIAGYYKNMQNLLEYREGTSLFSTKSEWKELVESGKGASYGSEFFIHKKTGRISGWISYTLAWSKRKFEEVNKGLEFFSSFDKRHDISIVANYQLKKHWNIGTNWVFNTGTPYSMPVYRINGSYVSVPNNGSISGMLIPIQGILVYEKKNNYRLPSYHRLDVSLNYTKPQKKHPNREQTWSFSAFNVYNRHNAFSRYWNDNYYGESSLFGILPSISYKLKF